MIHESQHKLAGQKVQIAEDVSEIGGMTILIEDWWDRVMGKSWMFCKGNPACMHYAMRTGLQKRRVPNDNEVVYGKLANGLGKLVHVSELVES